MPGILLLRFPLSVGEDSDDLPPWPNALGGQEDR